MRSSFHKWMAAGVLVALGLVLAVPADGQAIEALKGRVATKPGGTAAAPGGNPQAGPGDFRSVLMQAINQLLGMVAAEKQMGKRVPGLDRALVDVVDALVGRHVRHYWHHAHHHWNHHWRHHHW